MNWKVKSAIRHTLLALPGGERLYRWLTAGLLGTNAGMAYKWFRVLPAHVGVVREQFGATAREQRLWCFDSGATPAAGLAMALATDVPGLLTDRRDRLADRYLAVSRRVLVEKSADLATATQAPADRVAHLLAATAGEDARAALAAINNTYAGAHAAAEDADWQGHIGGVFSAGTLEHYLPEALEAEIARMARALAPGGVMSHVVDHRDHRWHADKRLCPLAHLTLEDAAYQQLYGNPLDYHNRLLRSDYAKLFTRHGFRVVCRDRMRYPADLPPLDRAHLVARFREASEDDLTSLVTHFIAVKAG